MPTVYIPKTGVEWLTVGHMFEARGWKVQYNFSTLQHSDLICFTGGEDVSPGFYDQEPHPTTFCDPERDLLECNIYHAFPNIPKVGICRGGQFLNVMSGGSMDQHIEGHRHTTHLIEDLHTNIRIEVNSDHHQMMWPLADADPVAATLGDDWEVLYYPHTKCLCFQPHPEWGHKPTEDYFFDLLERFFNLKGEPT